MMMIDVCLQEESNGQQVEKPPSETEVEKTEEAEEDEGEEEEDNDEEGDVQSFVTALENENDHVTESINGLHLGHDDDGKKFLLRISNIFLNLRLDYPIECQNCQIKSFRQWSNR